jgi:hypothetical protein
VGLFSRVGSRRAAQAAAPAAPQIRVEEDVVGPTKAFQKFVASLVAHTTPVLVDVGSVVGTNVTYFGERLGCKIHIANLYEELNRHIRERTIDRFVDCAREHLALPDGSVDGVLCWDLLDYLDHVQAEVVATELTRILRVNGALLAFFYPRAEQTPFYVKYAVVDETTLRHRRAPGLRARQGGLQNRDVIKLFSGLRVSDSFLLKSNVREIVLKKPAYLARVPAANGLSVA